MFHSFYGNDVDTTDIPHMADVWPGDTVKVSPDLDTECLVYKADRTGKLVYVGSGYNGLREAR